MYPLQPGISLAIFIVCHRPCVRNPRAPPNTGRAIAPPLSGPSRTLHTLIFSIATPGYQLPARVRQGGYTLPLPHGAGGWPPVEKIREGGPAGNPHGRKYWADYRPLVSSFGTIKYPGVAGWD